MAQELLTGELFRTREACCIYVLIVGLGPPPNAKGTPETQRYGTQLKIFHNIVLFCRSFPGQAAAQTCTCEQNRRTTLHRAQIDASVSLHEVLRVPGDRTTYAPYRVLAVDVAAAVAPGHTAAVRRIYHGLGKPWPLHGISQKQDAELTALPPTAASNRASTSRSHGSQIRLMEGALLGFGGGGCSPTYNMLTFLFSLSEAPGPPLGPFPDIISDILS
ncbi:hypothetical protein FN846DRAFT_885524 [Sphaerosporella brunnea]|uniref:Uncharacterized protein n=1 Tax=Sphaerosporella brunnea TaxID=1250544 RepID=A0A5J5FC56_9PEZI|nr:hypothetical protein FN846DRAFT_885524 [Sphaerosporella brunnea]